MAFTAKSGEKILVTKEETINESILITGQTITIDGSVNGDLFCFAQNVTIKGDIKGDVICGAQSINISGNISGSLRSASQSLQIDGVIVNNVSSFAQNISSGEKSVVNGELTYAGQIADLAGKIGGKLTGSAESVNLHGPVGKDVYLEVDKLNLNDKAAIAGTLTYMSQNNAVIGKGASVKEVVKKNPEKKKEQEDKNTPNPIQDFAGSVIWQSLFLFLLIYLFQDTLESLQPIVYKSPFKTFGLGIITLILPPVAILILIFTVFGIPIAIIFGCLYIVAIFVARAITGFLLGIFIVDKYLNKYTESRYFAGLVGIIAHWILLQLPIVGGLLSVISLFIGLGGIYHIVKSFRKNKIESKSASSSPGPLLA